jgi:hypothetical protein
MMDGMGAFEPRERERKNGATLARSLEGKENFFVSVLPFVSSLSLTEVK